MHATECKSRFPMSTHLVPFAQLMHDSTSLAMGDSDETELTFRKEGVCGKQQRPSLLAVGVRILGGWPTWHPPNLKPNRKEVANFTCQVKSYKITHVASVHITFTSVTATRLSKTTRGALLTRSCILHACSHSRPPGPVTRALKFSCGGRRGGGDL